MNKIVLLKYGEIILKGLNRPIFEDKLMCNIRAAAGNDASKVWKAQAAIYVEPASAEVDADELAVRLSRVFGVVSAAVAHVTEKDLGKISELAVQLTQAAQGETFKVASKRADKRFPMTSLELSMAVADAVNEAMPHLKADMHNPDILVSVEVRDFAAYVYLGKIPGVGGLPTGTSGRATLLLSGGIDSPVAGYMIAKRGAELNAVHFYSYPYTSERAKEKVLDLARILADFCGEITVHVVPFTDIQLAINDKCPPEEITVLMRRIMMYIANDIAKNTGAGALVTGESIAQVASQTMDALAVTDDAAELPVFRPVIGMDKEEIIQISRKIGTFETSILPYEDCCTVFTPKHPVTKPRLERIMKSEALLDVDGLVAAALAGGERVVLKRESRI